VEQAVKNGRSDETGCIMTNALQDKVALVTGGSTGIGLGIAKRFVSEGAFVFISGRRQAELDAAVAEIGENVEAIRSDVADLADLEGLFETIRMRKGRIDVLVANAGGGVLAPLGSVTEEQFDSMFAVNVKGVLFTVQKALPLLASGSRVILVASTQSVKASPGSSVYGATKAAVRNFARSWILELKERGIRVNVLSPGPTETPGLKGTVPAPEQQLRLDRFASNVPLGRVGAPDEIGKAAVFLASDASSFVNGAELFVDGGYAQV
jgi:NAD(P)-dependent dehydrogenase (short-subunit alcohol dehydrogenase family)